MGAVRPAMPAALIEFSLKEYLNRRYSEVGTVWELKLDLEAKRISLEIELKGETEPVKFTVERYEVSESDGKLFLEILDITASRQWLQALTPLLLKGKKIALPPMARMVFAV
jgi:hypothetical protein